MRTHEHVERGVQGFGDLGRDGDSAAREADDDHVTVDATPQCVGERSAGSGAVGEDHWGTISTGHGLRWTTRIATLPSATRARPDRPCEPMMTNDAGRSRAKRDDRVGRVRRDEHLGLDCLPSLTHEGDGLGDPRSLLGRLRDRRLGDEGVGSRRDRLDAPRLKPVLIGELDRHGGERGSGRGTVDGDDDVAGLRSRRVVGGLRPHQHDRVLRVAQDCFRGAAEDGLR